MKVVVFEKSTKREKQGEIKLALNNEFPSKKDNWNFNWRALGKIKSSIIYKIILSENPEQIEGLIMLTLINNEMLFMNNIEIAPHNIGSDKKYDNVAGCLLAFGCRESFTHGEGNYKGFLSFESKTELIQIYQNKYGASIAIGHKMYFNPESGKQLMKKYLGINK